MVHCLTEFFGNMTLVITFPPKQAAKCRIYSESDWLQETIGTVGIVLVISYPRSLLSMSVGYGRKIQWYEFNCRRGRPSKVRCKQAREVFPAGLYGR